MAAELTTGAAKDIVGRGVSEGARLFREWFDGLSAVAERGEGAAYCFVAGNLIEILRSFDIPVTFPEINALQIAFRNASREYLGQAEDYGYSPDICGYVKTDVAIQLRGGAHPMGRIPKPRLVLLNNYCNTFIKWGEIWERFHDCPVVSIDYPTTRAAGGWRRPGCDDSFGFERDYVRGQIEEMIEVCEGLTGTKFDIDKFRQILAWSNDVNRDWTRVVELNRNRPALFNALTDGTVFLGIANGLRGTEAGSRYFRELVEEMEYRVEHGIGVMERSAAGMAPMRQTFRLALVGTPCYPIYRQFNEMFARWGGVFVYSSYLDFASSGALCGYQYDLADPLTSYAEGQLVMHSAGMDSVFHESTNLRRSVPAFGLDGVVFHPVKSCRTVSTGMADMRRVVAEELGIATLFIESDLVDPQVVSEAQMKNRADAFFEGLITRRQQGA